MSNDHDYEVDRTRLPKDVCEHLCTKTMYVGISDPDATEEFPGRDTETAAYWCRLTQVSHGPDDDLADPDSCRPGRACCVARFRIEA